MLDVTETHGLAGGDARRCEGRGRLIPFGEDDLFFFDRVPSATLRAVALPLGVLGTTFGAVVDRLFLSHRMEGGA